MRSLRDIRGGFTMLEAAFAVALFGIVLFKLTMVVTDVSRGYEQESRITDLEDQARRVLERLVQLIQSSSREALFPDSESPLSSSAITYEVNLGVQGGIVVWSDPERIELGPNGEIFWRKNPGQPDEQRFTLSQAVATFLEGELMNGVDDNGNELVDEAGLSFTVDRNMVTIRLTLQRAGVEGNTIVYTVEAEATCRN